MITYIFNSDYLLTEKILPFLNDRVLLPGLAGRVLVELTSFESVTKVLARVNSCSTSMLETKLWSKLWSEKHFKSRTGPDQQS